MCDEAGHRPLSNNIICWADLVPVGILPVLGLGCVCEQSCDGHSFSIRDGRANAVPPSMRIVSSFDMRGPPPTNSPWNGKPGAGVSPANRKPPVLLPSRTLPVLLFIASVGDESHASPIVGASLATSEARKTSLSRRKVALPADPSPKVTDTYFDNAVSWENTNYHTHIQGHLMPVRRPSTR